jgi:hypothetical protein
VPVREKEKIKTMVAIQSFKAVVLRSYKASVSLLLQQRTLYRRYTIQKPLD